MQRLPRILLVIILLFCSNASFENVSIQSNDEYTLVWADEFDTDGSPSSDNWHFQTQWIIPGVGWANDEEQHYTDRLDNAIVEDGILKIIAKKERYTDDQGTRNYTSARLNSKFAFTYGKVDVRAKLPDGQGTWPAIWTLGTNINETGGFWNDGVNKVPWPVCGEIDIMEQFGQDKSNIHGTVHHGRESGGTTNSASTPLTTSTNEFHVYSIIWNETEIQFLVDEVVYYTYNPETKYPGEGRNGSNWPFDQPQYLLLNVAMGGVLGGMIDPNFTGSAMEIDYVRVYQNISGSSDATLSDLQIEGSTIEGFNPAIFEYSYDLPSNATDLPDISAIASNANASVSIIDATSLDGVTRILVTAENNFNSLEYTIDFNVVLGLDESIDLKLFPNPVTSHMSFSNPGFEISDISIVSMDGRLNRLPVTRSGTDYQVDVSGLSNGIYVMEIKVKDEVIHRKFVKR